MNEWVDVGPAGVARLRDGHFYWGRAADLTGGGRFTTINVSTHVPGERQDVRVELWSGDEGHALRLVTGDTIHAQHDSLFPRTP